MNFNSDTPFQKNETRVPNRVPNPKRMPGSVCETRVSSLIHTISHVSCDAVRIRQHLRRRPFYPAELREHRCYISGIMLALRDSRHQARQKTETMKKGKAQKTNTRITIFYLRAGIIPLSNATIILRIQHFFKY